MIEKTLENLKIASLNGMQQAALKAAEKADVILLAPTGSGKTLAFLLPLLMRLDKDISMVQVFILVPSRELALQIEQVFKLMRSGFKVNCCYGGHPVKTELNNFSQPPAVLIGTPGRVAHHLRRSSFSTANIHTLVLDEFDKSLEFGFQDDMTYIIHQLPNLKWRMLTSATAMKEIPAFTGISFPVEVNHLANTLNIPGLLLKTIISPAADKLDTLFALICKIGEEPAIVFCNHREAVDRVSDLLWNRGISHGVFHGGMEQDDRERELIKFRNGSNRLLITTDLASRGLDIPEIAYVVHYQLPLTEEAFLHRNGRTARMNAKGTSYLILTAGEKLTYLKQDAPVELLPRELKIPKPTPWATLYIAAGKKEKISKTDIAGFLLQKAKLPKDDVGRIEVLDHSAYVALKRSRVEQALELLKTEKIKNKKIKIEISS